MASVQYLFSLANTFSNELDFKQGYVDTLTEYRIQFAIFIQKIWRGFKARKVYHKIRNAVVIIQAYYRGWIIRKNIDQIEERCKFEKHILYQNSTATKIQSWWRGVKARKNMKGRLPKELLKERRRLNQINAEMGLKIRALMHENLLKDKVEANEMKEHQVQEILYKCHYLLRTYVMEGIYSCHGKKELSLVESIMKSLQFKDYMDELHKLYHALSKESKLKDKKLKFDRKERASFGDESIMYHKKPFILTAKVPKEKYQKSLLNEVKYKESIVKPTELDSKKISDKDFNLDVTHLELQDPVDPYYIDYWENEIFNRNESN